MGFKIGFKFSLRLSRSDVNRKAVPHPKKGSFSIFNRDLGTDRSL